MHYMHKRYIAIFCTSSLIALYLVVDVYQNNSIFENESMSPAFSQSKDSAPRNIKLENMRGAGINLTEAFKSREKNGFLEELDNLTARGIPGTPENIGALDKLFKISDNSEEKIRLARLYNAAYFGTEDTSLRKRISQTISDLLRLEADPAVGRALTLSHSRMLIDEQTQENLEYAYRRNFLSNDDYYGELAHIIPGAMGPVRSEIIKKITSNHNQYASEIIADFIASSSELGFPMRK